MFKKIRKKILLGGLVATTLIPIATPALAATQPTTKTITIENKKVTVPVKGVKWVDINGHWHFIENGTMVTGWKQLGPAQGEKTVHYSYFDKKTGRLYKDWQYMDAGEGEKSPHWSYFGDNGWMRTGWVQFGKGTSNPDGNSAKHWSYFGDNGWMRKGWVEFGKGTANPDGNSARHWSYFGDNGWMKTGWVQLGKGTANPDGNVAKHWSYFGDNGWLRTGLQTMGNAQNPDSGKYQHLSYFGGNGWLVENKDFSTGGKNYYADKAGWAMNMSGTQMDGSLYSTNGRKTIIIGDSRTVMAYQYRSGETLPKDPKYGKQIANRKVKGKEIYWAMTNGNIENVYKRFENVIYDEAKKDPKNTDVVWLLGVNDSCSTKYGWDNTAQYANALKKLKSTGANVYYVTVNRTNNFVYQKYVYEQAIPVFNNKLIDRLKGSGVKLIDSYNNVKLAGKGDGGDFSDDLHYSRNGTNKIMKYVLGERPYAKTL